tara:strand:+ start:8744 stop:8959 length:216 start_codon:yes stop_codon:yes gene_type:complete
MQRKTRRKKRSQLRRRLPSVKVIRIEKTKVWECVEVRLLPRNKVTSLGVMKLKEPEKRKAVRKKKEVQYMA